MSLDITPEDEFGRVPPSDAEDAQGTALVSIEATVPTVETLISKAVEHGISVEGLEKLLAMHERMAAAAAKKAFFEALSAFQADCPVIGKGRTANVTTQGGGSYTYSYAPLEDIMQAVVPVLRLHGLSVRFDARFEDQAQLVTCIVNHRDGHSEQSEFRAPINPAARGMNVTQQSASALTYGRRYALLNALGIVVGGEDDDGRAAAGRGVATSRVAPGGTTAVAPQQPAPSPSVSTSSGGTAGGATPRPLGRNLVRIPRPSQGPQGSDGASLQGEAVGPYATSPVAETPAVPESDASNQAKAELRQSLIADWSRLLRATGKFDDLDDATMWDKAVDVLSAQCEMQYKRPLHEMNLEALRHARQMTDETLEKKGLVAA